MSVFMTYTYSLPQPRCALNDPCVWTCLRLLASITLIMSVFQVPAVLGLTELVKRFSPSLSLHFTFATTRPRTFFAVMYPINTPANCVILCSHLRLVLIPVSWPTTRKRSPRVFGHRRRCCDYPETRRWQREVATGGSDGGSTVDAG